MSSEPINVDAGEGAKLSLFESAVQSLGRALNDLTLYGRDHSVTRGTLERGHAALALALEASPVLAISVANEEGLVVNGVGLPARTPTLLSLVARLGDLKLANFTVKAGLRLNELESLVIVLGSPVEEIEAAGGFTAVLPLLGVKHVEVSRARYALLQDGEEVTSGTGTRNIPLVPEAEALVAKIVADGGPDDLEHLAGRILKSLQESYAAICGNGVLDTQKGRRQTVRTLKEVSRQLDEQLPATLDDDSRERIRQSVEGMVDEVMVESLAEDYLKRRKLFEDNEARLLRYLGKREDDVLHERLIAAGVDEREWSVLLWRARQGPGRGCGREGNGDESGLDTLLQEVRKLPGAESDNVAERERMLALLHEVDQEVARLTQATETRIAALEEELRAQKSAEVLPADKAPGEAPPGAVSKPPRKSIIALVAEVSQELHQPLSVVLCALELVMRKGGERLPAPMPEALQLALREATRLGQLLERLSSIAGLPASLTPDLAVRESLYA